VDDTGSEAQCDLWQVSDLKQLPFHSWWIRVGTLVSRGVKSSGKILALFALTGLPACGATQQRSEPSVFVVFPQAVTSTVMPASFLEREIVLERGCVHGMRVAAGQLCVLVMINGIQCEIGISGAVVAKGLEAAAIGRAAEAAKYRWVLRQCSPVTSAGGILQAEVVYDTGRARGNLGKEIAGLR